jgi:hypothetical protein
MRLSSIDCKLSQGSISQLARGEHQFATMGRSFDNGTSRSPTLQSDDGILGRASITAKNGQGLIGGFVALKILSKIGTTRSRQNRIVSVAEPVKRIIRKEYIMDRQYLELFKQLIRLKTTHAPENLSAHDRCRDLLKAEAEKRGLKTRIIPSDPYPSLLAGLEVDSLNPALMLSCHLDVVQAQDEQFEPQIKGSRMIGRGTSDMKFAAPVFFQCLGPPQVRP